MSKIRITPTCQWFGTTLLLLPFLLVGCSDIRYDENTRIYNQNANDNPGTSHYTTGRNNDATARYNSTPGPQTIKYTHKPGGKRYSIGKYEEATDYYVNRQKNSDINPKKPQMAKREGNFPANLTPEEQRASLPLVIEVSDVLFDFDKAIIKSAFVPELDKWVDYFTNNPGVTADIYGYADSTGPATYNQTLSEQRAKAVINYMVDRGIERERLMAKGFGETRPAASNVTKEGRQKNRRVELNF